MSRRSELVFLSQEDVIETGVGMERIIEIAERVLVMHEEKTVRLPSKVSLQLGFKEKGQRINAMPAYIGGEFEICGIKWIASTPSNPEKYDIPRAHALAVLNDSGTGEPVAIMDATYISAMRTGAMTGVGIKHLANQNCEVAGIIGSGVQAKTQIQALKVAAPTIKKIKVYSLHEENRKSFANWIEQDIGLDADAVESAQSAVEGSEIIIAATTANESFVKDEWIKEGSLFVHVGGMQEEDEIILNSDKVITDNWQQILDLNLSDLARLYNEGKIDDNRIHANIGEIIVENIKGRESERERILYFLFGLGTVDIAVLKVIYDEAVERNLGQSLILWEKPAIG